MPRSAPHLLPLAAALQTLFSAAAFATGETPLEPVVITAPRSDGAFSTTSDNASLTKKKATTSDAASLLADIPGVSLQGAGGVSSLPAIHGLADDRLRIKVDGMDLIAACPNHMNSPLSYLDPSNVGTLKVWAGITPVSLGGDSIGGTIVADTPTPDFAAPGQGTLFKGQIGASYRSNNNATSGNVSATVASDVVSLSYSGAVAKADNYKAGGDFKTSGVTGRIGHTLALDEVGSTAFEARNHTLGLALKNANHLFEAKLGYQDIPYELYPNQRMDMLGNTANRLNLRYLGQFDWGKLEARAYHEKVSHHMDFGDDKRFWYGNGAPPTGSGGPAAPNGTPCSPISATCAAGMPMDTESKNTGLSIKADINLSQQDLLRLGTEFQNYRLNDWWPPSGAMMMPNTFWNIRDGKRDRLALFGEWEKHFSPEWMGQLGLRHERVRMDTGLVHGYNQATFPTVPAAGANNQIRDAANFNNANRSKSDSNWDLTALARYTPDTGRDIEFGVSHKTRSPNLHERFAWSTWSMAALMVNWNGDGNGYIGNLDLKPEKANTLSATFDWHAADRSWEVKFTPYVTQVVDYIDAVQWNATTNTARTALLTNQFTVLKFVNQSARLQGFDLSGHMPLAKTGIGELGFKGLLNYTRGKNRDTGDNLYNIMPLNARLTLTQQLGGWDNGLELILVQQKTRLSAVRNEFRTPGYGLVSLRASYSWKQTRVDFGIENLFDKAYNLPMGGAYNGQGTTMTTTGVSSPVWGVGVPGMGRSAYVAATYKF